MGITSEPLIANQLYFSIPACEGPQWLSYFKLDLKGKGLHRRNTDAPNQYKNV